MYPIGQSIEALCLLAALLFLRQEKSFFWRSFIGFLAFVLAVELLGHYYAVRRINNAWLYNLYQPVAVVFYASILFRHLKGKVARPLLVMAILLYAATFFSELYLHRAHYLYNADTASALMIVIGCGTFYYQLMREEEYVELSRFPPFWLINGIFLYHFGSIVCTIYSRELHGRVGPYYLQSILFTLLTLIMSACWINAFRWHYRTRS